MASGDPWVSAKVWAGRFPELADERVSLRPNVGIALSGGGNRAYSASIGLLRALTQLGLLGDHVRYLSAVSGGSWAATAYTYYSRGAPGVADSDIELLGGQPVAAADLSLSGLATMPPRAMGVASTDKRNRVLAGIDVSKTDGVVEIEQRLRAAATRPEALAQLERSLRSAWVDMVYSVYLAPVGIGNHSWAWHADEVAELRARNEELGDAPFALPADESRPFLIVNAVLLGPSASAPWLPSSWSSLRRFEFTSSYVGVYARPLLTSHLLPALSIGSTVEQRLGGFVQPLGFGGPNAPPNGSATRQAGGSGGAWVRVPAPQPESRLSLGDAVGWSSCASGIEWANIAIINQSQAALSLLTPQASYWPPAAAVDGGGGGGDGGTDTTTPVQGPPSTATLFADGGTIDNSGVIDLLVRGTTTIVALLSSSVPLAGRHLWDPSEREPTPDVDADCAICSLFGVGSCLAASFGLQEHNHVFEIAQFAPLMRRMQDRIAAGDAAVVTIPLTTVANEWWGVEAGVAVSVTWLYLSHYERFYLDLPPEVNTALRAGAFGPSPWSGEHTAFPHLDIMATADVFTPSQANLIAHQVAASVLANEQLFQAALGAPPAAPSAAPYRLPPVLAAIGPLAASAVAVLAALMVAMRRRRATPPTLEAGQADGQASCVTHGLDERPVLELLDKTPARS